MAIIIETYDDMKDLKTIFITLMPVLLLFTVASTSGQQNDWENQRVVGINKEYYHVNTVPYTDLGAALNHEFRESPYFKLLNGTWKVNYVLAA